MLLVHLLLVQKCQFSHFYKNNTTELQITKLNQIQLKKQKLILLVKLEKQKEQKMLHFTAQGHSACIAITFKDTHVMLRYLMKLAC